MAIYLISFILSYAFTKYATIYKNNKALFFVFSIIAISIPAFVAGVRDSIIGTDTINYDYDFEVACDTHSLKYYLFNSNVTTEIGFSVYTYFVSCITRDIYGYQFITHFIIIALFYTAIMRLSNILKPKFAILIFLLLCFNESLNITRQFISLGFLLLALTYLMENRKNIFFLLILLAVSFHYSAALAVIYYPLNMASSRWPLKKHKFKYLVLLAVILFAVYIAFVYTPLQTYFMNIERYSGYFEKGDNGLSNSTLLIYIFMVVISYSILKLENKSFDMLYVGSVASILLLFASVFSSTLYRLALVFEIVFCLSVPIVLYSRQLRFRRYAVVCMLLFYWFFVVVIRGSYSTFPYQSIFLSQLLQV